MKKFNEIVGLKKVVGNLTQVTKPTYVMRASMLEDVRYSIDRRAYEKKKHYLITEVQIKFVEN